MEYDGIYHYHVTDIDLALRQGPITSILWSIHRVRLDIDDLGFMLLVKVLRTFIYQSNTIQCFDIRPNSSKVSVSFYQY